MGWLVVARLAAAPALIWLATAAGRRWGSEVSGLLSGLPLTSAPLSFILALEQGRDFAAEAAKATISGLLSVVVFVATYAVAARRLRWPASLLISCITYLATAALIMRVAPGLPVSMAMLVPALAGLLWRPTRGEARNPTLRHPRWDVPARMIVAAATVASLAALATRLGPAWTGLLSPAPVFAAVMLVFCHIRSGRWELQLMTRGILVGTFPFAAFFCCIALCLPSLGMAAFAIAMGVAAAVGLPLNRGSRVAGASS